MDKLWKYTKKSILDLLNMVKKDHWINIGKGSTISFIVFLIMSRWVEDYNIITILGFGISILVGIMKNIYTYTHNKIWNNGDIASFALGGIYLLSTIQIIFKIF